MEPLSNVVISNIDEIFNNPNFLLILEKLDLISTPQTNIQDVNTQVSELLAVRIEFMLYIMIFISVLLLFQLIRTMRS